MRTRPATLMIAVHCSATPNSGDFYAEDVVEWHTAPKSRKGNGWKAVGYHWIIERDGTVVPGRPLHVTGAHARRHNRTSVGICLMGGLNDDWEPDPDYTERQMVALRMVVGGMLAQWPDAVLVGHRELDSRKDCPCFDVMNWYRTGEVR